MTTFMGQNLGAGQYLRIEMGKNAARWLHLA